MDTIKTIQDLSMFNGSARLATVALTRSEMRLIAAAPELLEALTGLLHAFPGDYTEPPVHIVAARAAIKKATGDEATGEGA